MANDSLAGIQKDPLHDSKADDEDQQWVAKELLRPDEKDLRASDAVLNCPGCFTPVCYQCQRHEEFSRQFRAAEVHNCDVDRSQSFSMGKGDSVKYYAVRCKICRAEVGLLDNEDVYHLFQVLESLG